MAEETIDPGLLEQTKNQIRRLVSEIAELAESDIQPAEFQVEFLNRVVAAVAASGGALWMQDGRGGLKLQHQLEFRQTGLLENRQKAQPHDALLGVMMQASAPQIIPPGAAVEGMPQAGNPTNFTLILAPLVVDKQNVGLVEILMDPTRRAATQKSTLRFVSDLCDLATQYLKNRQMRQVMSQQRLWNQLEGFTHSIHGSLDMRETAYSVANEGKRLVASDRLSVALKIGGRMMVEAISGQEIVEQRANLVRELTRLCKVVVQSGEDLVYTGNTDGFPPDIKDAVEIYVDESGSKALVATILYKPETDASKDKVAYGCLVAEQIGDEMAPTDMHARTEVVARHASTALWNSSEHDKIFGIGVLKMIGSPMRFFRGRTLAKILAVFLALVLVICILAFVPWQLTIQGQGSILPKERRKTYAPVAGIVLEVLKDHGDVVQQGEVVVRLESKELAKELLKLMADRDAAADECNLLEKQLAKETKPDEKTQIQGKMEEAFLKRESASKQIEIINEQIQLMDIRAPHTGVVTTWQARREFQGRPVEIGQELVEISGTEGDWELEVDVPDDDMEPILEARSKLQAAIAAGTKPSDSKLEAYFVTATDPEHRYQGYVTKIAAKAETTEGKHNVKVTVGFDEKVRADFLKRNQKFRPGAEVRARVRCGEARLAYVLLRDVIQVFYETVLFRWPFLTNK
jgi:multidrug efflux pump subunit AcrA (membrane-fusion protein)